MEIPILTTKQNNKPYSQQANENGTYINIPASIHIDTPIFILYTYVNKPTPSCSMPHNNIVLEKNSKAHIIEIYLSEHENSFHTKAHTTIQMQDNANLTYTILQQATITDQQNLGVHITQHANTAMHGQIFNYGGGVNRININSILSGANASCNFNVLQYATHTAIHTLNLHIEHQHAHTTSNSVIKSVVDDQAKCSVSGKILVPANITAIKANLQHKTMLLSEHAQIESKPQQEIYNDNVSCSHGSSIGKLDADALLYMATRGIPFSMAKNLLLQGFIAPSINAISCANFRQQVQQLFYREVNI